MLQHFTVQTSYITPFSQRAQLQSQISTTRESSLLSILWVKFLSVISEIPCLYKNTDIV